MKRPSILEENNDLLEQVNYLIAMDKYCDYLEKQNKQLTLTSVSQQRELLLDYIMKSSSKHVHIDDATHWVNQYFRKKSNNCG